MRVAAKQALERVLDHVAQSQLPCDRELCTIANGPSDLRWRTLVDGRVFRTLADGDVSLDSHIP